METIVVKEPKKCSIVFACPGLTATDLQVTFDPKSGVLDVEGKPKESILEKVTEEWDLKISFTTEVETKYRSKKVGLTVNDGIAIVTLGIARGIVTVSND